MKKILLLCDGNNFPSGAIRFIRQMRESESIYVKAVFYTEVDLLEAIPVGFNPVSGPYEQLKEQELTRVHANKKRFREAVENDGIKFDVHPTEGAWDIDAFKTESRFADLVVISGDLFSQKKVDTRPNYFMTDALRSSECPIAVIPETFNCIERLVVAYDGERESMHATKQFVYLFPDLTRLPTEIVHVKEESKGEMPNRDLLWEYTLSHFDAQYTSNLHFDPKRYFASWLEERKNVLLVTGSYSRSSFSNIMKKSFTEKIIAEQTCPVFIAHFS